MYEKNKRLIEAINNEDILMTETIPESDDEDEEDSPIPDFEQKVETDYSNEFESGEENALDMDYKSLTAGEKSIYGDTCPPAFRKQYIIARGKQSLIWLGKSDKKVVLMKQYPKDSEEALSQIKIYNSLFDKDGDKYDPSGKSLIALSPGIGYVAKLVSQYTVRED